MTESYPTSETTSEIIQHLDLETLLIKNVQQITDPRELAEMAYLSRKMKHTVNKKINQIGILLKHQYLKRFPILKRLQYQRGLKVRLINESQNKVLRIDQLKFEIQDAKIHFRHKKKGEPLALVVYFKDPDHLIFRQNGKDLFQIDEVQEVKQ